MPKSKKPAPKGGKKAAAPKKVAKKAAKRKPSVLAPTNDRSGFEGMVGPAGSDAPIQKLTERQIDQLNADTAALPLHPTVEEQFSAEERRRMDVANGLARRVEREFAARQHSLDNPSLLRRAWDRVKRAFRYRSAKTGEYVTKQYAEANPDTTVREKAD